MITHGPIRNETRWGEPPTYSTGLSDGTRIRLRNLNGPVIPGGRRRGAPRWMATIFGAGENSDLNGKVLGPGYQSRAAALDAAIQFLRHRDRPVA